LLLGKWGALEGQEVVLSVVVVVVAHLFTPA